MSITYLFIYLVIQKKCNLQISKNLDSKIIILGTPITKMSKLFQENFSRDYHHA